MAILIDTDTQNVMVQAIADEFDTPAGTLKIYENSGDGIPSSANTAITNQPLLATVTLPTPSFGTASSGTVSDTGDWSTVQASASGTAGFFRLEADSATYCIQGTVSTSGADLNFDSVTFVSGGNVTITSFDLVMPSGE